MNKFLFTSVLFLSLFSIGVPSAFALSASYLVVAGGGGGAVGGGGGGGFLAGSGYTVTLGSPISVTVGNGGGGVAAGVWDVTGTNGGNSTFGPTVTSFGGGGGGRLNSATSNALGANGGSGGGGGFHNSSPTPYDTGGSGTTGQGYSGGSSYDNSYNNWLYSYYASGGGAGGGAGGYGGTADSDGETYVTAAAGGPGLPSSISGASVYYSGGGGASMSSNGLGNPNGANGSGGGTGSYGGGGFSHTAGGPGVVIVSYPTSAAYTCTGGTVTTSGANTINKFTSSGTFSCVSTDCINTPWGTMTNGTSHIAYSTSLAPYGSFCTSYAEMRTCTNTVLSGSYTITSCSVATDTTAPTTPGAMTTTWVGDHYVNSNFTAATTGSTDSQSGMRGYRLCRSNDNAGGCSVWTGAGEHAGTSEVVSGADLPSAGAFRYYYWYAYDNAGNQSANSTDVYVRMDSAPPISTPSTPANGGVLTGNGTSNVTFTTNAVADPAGQTVQYYFRVATGADGETGAVCNSNWQASTSYTCTTVGYGLRYWHVYTLDWVAQTNPNYVWSFTMNKAAQATLTTTAQTVTYPTAFTALASTGGTGGGGVTYAVTSAGAGCSISGTTLSYTSAGTCGVTATKAADGNYNAIASAQQTFTINTAAQTASITTTSAVYTGSVISRAVTCSGGGTPTPATVSGTTVGPYTATISCAASGNYALTGSLNPGSFSITKATQAAVTLGTQTVTYTPAGNNFTTLSAAGGNGTGAYSYAVTGAGAGCSIAGAVLSYTSAGTCGVTATRALDTNYNVQSSTQTTFTINQSPQATLTTSATTADWSTSITVSATGGTTAGTQTFYASNNTATGCSIVAATGVLTATSAGTCSVYTTMAGNTNYTLVTSATISATFTARAQATFTVTAQTVTYVPAGNNFSALSLSAAGSGTGAVTYAVTTPGAGCSITGTTLTYTSAGTCGVTATKAADTNYTAISSAAQTFTVSQAAQATLTTSATTADWSTSITVSATGGTTAGTQTFYASNNTATGCSIVASTGVLTATSAGTCSVYTTMAGNTNYTLVTSATISATFTARAQATLTVTAQTATYPATFTALATTGGTGTGAVTYVVTSAGTAGCSVVGTTLLYTSAGTCTVTATKAADTNYTAVSSVAATFTAVKVYTLTVTTGANGSTSGPSGTYNDGQVVTLTATPNANYYLTSWTGDADCSDGLVTMTTDVSCTANFGVTTYQDPPTGTSVSSLALNQATLSWTNPPSLGSTIMIVRSLSPITISPVYGTAYTAGSNIDAGTSVVYSGAESTFIDSGLTGGFSYYYKIFAKNPFNGYSTGVSPVGSPVIVLGSAPAINQIGYLWRNDDSPGSSAVNQNTALSSGVYVGDRRRLRFQITNGSAYAANGYNYRLEYSTDCTDWNPVPIPGELYTNQPWIMDISPYISNGFSTSHYSGLDSQVGSFVPGLFNFSSNETTIISLPANSYSELEYSLKSTSNAVPGGAYCFRLTNGGSTNSFTYSNIPQIILHGVTSRPEYGGGSFETPSATPSGAVTGGGGGNGGGESAPSVPSSPIETSAPSAPPVQGGTPSGSGGNGGGDVGFLYNGMKDIFNNLIHV